MTIISKISLWSNCQEKYSLMTTSHEHSSPIQPGSGTYIHALLLEKPFCWVLLTYCLNTGNWNVMMKFWHFVSSWCCLYITYTFHSCTYFTLNCFEYSFLSHMDAITVTTVIIYLFWVMSNSKRNCVSPYIAFKIFPFIVEIKYTNSISFASGFKVLSFLYFF